MTFNSKSPFSITDTLCLCCSPNHEVLRTVAGSGREASQDTLPHSAYRHGRPRREDLTGGAMDACFTWIYSMALCPVSDILYVAQDDGALREVEIKVCVAWCCVVSYFHARTV